MNYQTVIGFYIDSHDGLSVNQVVDKIQKLSSYLISRHDFWNWGIKDSRKLDSEDSIKLHDENHWITDINQFKNSFDNFIEYIKNNGVDDDDGCCIVSESSPRYETSGIDIENGDIEFDHSFEIDRNVFNIYLNTEALFASEITSLQSANLGLGIYCEMNDIDNDYFEFKI
jgi:hypothetical protein